MMKKLVLRALHDFHYTYKSDKNNLNCIRKMSESGLRKKEKDRNIDSGLFEENDFQILQILIIFLN